MEGYVLDKSTSNLTSVGKGRIVLLRNRAEHKNVAFTNLLASPVLFPELGQMLRYKFRDILNPHGLPVVHPKKSTLP